MAAASSAMSTPRCVSRLGEPDRQGLGRAAGQDQREQEFVPAQDEAEQAGGEHAGRRHRHGDPRGRPASAWRRRPAPPPPAARTSPSKKATSIQARNGMLMVRCAMTRPARLLIRPASRNSRNSGSTRMIGGSIWLASTHETERRAAGVVAREGIGHARWPAAARSRSSRRATTRLLANQRGEIVAGEDLDVSCRAERADLRRDPVGGELVGEATRSTHSSGSRIAAENAMRMACLRIVPRRRDIPPIHPDAETVVNPTRRGAPHTGVANSKLRDRDD